MSRQATHTGTCQICGRRQMLPSGMLAKHGYNVEHHFFSGVCPGADYPPLELDRTLADKVAADLLVQSRNEQRAADDLMNGVTLPDTAKSGRTVEREVIVRGALRVRRVDEMVPFAEAPGHYQRERVKQLAYEHCSRSRQAQLTSKGITERADKIHGKQELKPRVTEQRKQIVPGMRVKIGGVERTVLRIEDRVARGQGPHLNGQVMPHAVFENSSGQTFAYPVRLIRQSSIIE